MSADPKQVQLHFETLVASMECCATLHVADLHSLGWAPLNSEMIFVSGNRGYIKSTTVSKKFIRSFKFKRALVMANAV
jgi:hypothetical protein